MKRITLDVKHYGLRLRKPLFACVLFYLLALVMAQVGADARSAVFLGVLSIFTLWVFAHYVMASQFYRDTSSLHLRKEAVKLPSPASFLWGKFLSGFFLSALITIGAVYGLYTLLQSPAGEHIYPGLAGIVDFLIKYFGRPVILLLVGIFFFVYIFFFALYSLSVSLGIQWPLRKLGDVGAVLASLGITYLIHLMSILSREVPLALRIFLNPRWHQMLTIVREKPDVSLKRLWSSMTVLISTTYVDLNIVGIVLFLLFPVVSIFFVHRTLREEW